MSLDTSEKQVSENVLSVNITSLHYWGPQRTTPSGTICNIFRNKSKGTKTEQNFGVSHAR